MQDLFKGYYQPTPEQFEEMWEEGTFVFDTNVLLNLYRYKEESKDEILNVIKKLEGRIWIPYQVGLEFHNGRLAVLNTQNKDLSAIKGSIRQSINSIEKKCTDLKLDERHSDVKTSSFMGRFKELSDSVIKELDEIKPKKLTNDTQDDSILTEISSLFNSTDKTLGMPPANQEVLDKIYKEGDFRAKNRIPPSYEDILKADKNKGDEKFYSFEGLYYKKGYSDLIIWKQIIEFAKDNEKKNIVFITDDTKEDWMRAIGLDSNSNNKEIISARPELVSEIFKEALVENFYIYNTNGFLNYSNIYLKAMVSDEALEDIKITNDNIIINNEVQRKLSIEERAIEDWLSKKYSLLRATHKYNSHDYIAKSDFGGLVTVYVKVINNFILKYIYFILNDLRNSPNKRTRKHIHIVMAIEKDIDFESQKYYELNEDFMSSAEIVDNFINKQKKLENLNQVVLVTLGHIVEKVERFEKIFEYQIVVNE